jgi:hypothetical protein
MAEHAQLDAPCKDGRLIITCDAVSVQPLRRTRRTRVWTLPRFAVSSVDIRRVGVRYELTVQTHEARTYAVTELNPPDAFAAVSLLGYAWAALPGQRRVTRRLGETVVRCKWGKLVIAPEQVALQPRLGFRRHGWVLPRAAISGVGYQGMGGERLVHDLVIYTLAGTAFPVYEVAPTDALTVARLLGFVRDAYPIGHAPIRPPARPTMPLPGAGFSPAVDVVIVPAPTDEPRRPHAPSPVGGFHARRSRRDTAPYAEPIAPPPRHSQSLNQSQPAAQPAEREQAGTEAGAGAGAATHGFSTPAGMLAALALLAAGTIATVTGHGLPEGWGAPNSLGKVGGGVLSYAATATRQADTPDTVRPRHAKQGAAGAPTKHQATPTPAHLAPAVASQRPRPTARPTSTATAKLAATATAQPTATAMPAPTATATVTATPTATPVPTMTPTPIPTATATAPSTATPKPPPNATSEQTPQGQTPQGGGPPTPVTTP